VIKYFIWILTLLSFISWSNILFVFNATFSYIVIKDFIWIFGFCGV